MQVGDKVKEYGGEIGVIVRRSGRTDDIIWVVELDPKPELSIPTTEIPFRESELCLLL